MKWTNLLENPEALQSIFPDDPSLTDVELMSLALDRDGPTLALAIQLNDYPTKPPARWKKLGANTVVLKLQVLGLESLYIEGWTIENRVTIDVSRKTANAITLNVKGLATKLTTVAGWLRVQGLDPYQKRA